MQKIGYIEIRIKGSVGNLDLAPENFDIKEIRNLLEQVENLLIPTDKKDRPIISYQIEAGSIRNIFKTSVQYVIGFNAVLGQINNNSSIDFLELSTAKAFETFQEKAIKKNFSFEIRTSIEKTNTLTINKNTRFYRTESIWGEAEFYFYGRITNMGGKEKSNIHILTEDLGIITIQTQKDYLEKLEKNLLYKTYGIRAMGKQHLETGEIDRSSLLFLELIDYEPRYDENYLKLLRKKASDNWIKNIDPDEWLKQLRGGYDA